MSAFLSSLFGSERLIGIDLGGTNINLVQVEAQRDRVRILHAAHLPTPPQAIKDGIVLDTEAIAACIRQMVRNEGISATGAVIAVSGPTVTVRKVRLPRMQENALRKSARYEASKLMAVNVDDSALAVDILGAVPDNTGQMEVMLVAAPRQMVNSRVDAVEAAGLEAVAVDLEAFALQRSVVECRRSMWDDGRLRMLVDIAASHTEVILLRGTEFLLTRSIPLAGNSFTQAVSAALSLEFPVAETRKRDINLAVLVDGGSEERIALARTIQGTLDELLREVRRSFNYYQTQVAESSEEPLAEIVLVGGSSTMHGIAPYIQARLTTPTRVANVLASSVFAGAHEVAASPYDGPYLGVALGLALKELALGPMRGKR